MQFPPGVGLALVGALQKEFATWCFIMSPSFGVNQVVRVIVPTGGQFTVGPHVDVEDFMIELREKAATCELESDFEAQHGL